LTFVLVEIFFVGFYDLAIELKSLIWFEIIVSSYQIVF